MFLANQVEARESHLQAQRRISIKHQNLPGCVVGVVVDQLGLHAAQTHCWAYIWQPRASYRLGRKWPDISGNH